MARALPARSVALAAWLVALWAGLAWAQGTVIDRVLASVDGQLVTLSDLRTATALGLVEGTGEEAVGKLVDRRLIVGEASRYAVQDPSAAAVDARLAALRASVGEARLNQVLRAGGLTEAGLREWLREDLLVASYMSQRFAATGMPTDSEVEAYVQAHQGELTSPGTARVSADETTRLARERLAGERRARLVSDWIAGLRRRAQISLRPVTP